MPRAAEGARKRQRVQPFISGHFEYGLGRPASKRTVFMFMRKGHLAGECRRELLGVVGSGAGGRGAGG